MTTRDEFEKWTRERGGLSTSRYAHPDVADYSHTPTETAWNAWQARQQEINALKAEIQRLKSKDHIRDTTKMILPPEISRQLLGKIVDEVFSGAIEDIYRVIAEHQLEHKLDMVEPLVRYCPGCGSIGPVNDRYLDCCPDGSDARMIPQALAEKCQHTFRSAIKKITARARAIDNPNEDAPDAPMQHTTEPEE